MNQVISYPQEIIEINRNAHREGFVVGVMASIVVYGTYRAFVKMNELGPIEKKVFKRFSK